MFIANCLFMLRKGITTLMLIGRPERLTFGTPAKSNNPPASAVTTYRIFPMLFKTGPRVLARLLACSASAKSASLRRSNSATLSLSLQKTLTTFRPLIISSTYPSRRPVFFCCLRKFRELLPPIFFVTFVMMIIPAKVMSVSHNENHNIIPSTHEIVTTAVIIWGIA